VEVVVMNQESAKQLFAEAKKIARRADSWIILGAAETGRIATW